MRWIANKAFDGTIGSINEVERGEGSCHWMADVLAAQHLVWSEQIEGQDRGRHLELLVAGPGGALLRLWK